MQFRERVGAQQLSKIFKRIVHALGKSGHVRAIYMLVDSSKIEARVDTWKARDKAIADAENDQRDDDDKSTMNNKNLKQYSSERDGSIENEKSSGKHQSSVHLAYVEH